MLLLALLTACDGGTDATKTDDTAATTCEITVQSTLPTDGATGVPGDLDVEFDLSAADPTATITGDVPGTTTALAGGTRLLWTPDAPLTADSTHTVTLDYCHGTIPISFTTSSYGQPLDGSVDLVDGAWEVPLDGVTWVDPTGVGSLVASFGAAPLLFGVSHASGSSIDFRVAIEDGATGAQDYCSRSFDIPGATLSGAWFSVDAEQLSFDAFDTTVIAYDVEVDGAFSSDGASIGGGRIRALLDLATVAGLISDTSTSDDVCELFGAMGATCSACPDDRNECAAVWINGIDGSIHAGPVENIAASDSDPRCTPE